MSFRRHDRHKKSSRRKRFALAAATVLGISAAVGTVGELTPKDPATDTHIITTVDRGTPFQQGYNISLHDQLWRVTTTAAPPHTQATALVRAARDGDSWRVRALLSAGFDLTHQDAGLDAARAAAQNGHGDVLRDLVRGGLDLRAVTQDALARQDGTLLDMAAAHGARLSAQEARQHERTLFAAARGGDTRFVTGLIGAGVDAHAQDDRALVLAARNGHSDTVRVLLAAGLDPSAYGSEGFLAAVARGHRHTADILLSHRVRVEENGATVMARVIDIDMNNGEALRLSKDNPAMTALLLRHGAAQDLAPPPARGNAVFKSGF